MKGYKKQEKFRQDMINMKSKIEKNTNKKNLVTDFLPCPLDSLSLQQDYCRLQDVFLFSQFQKIFFFFL